MGVVGRGTWGKKEGECKNNPSSLNQRHYHGLRQERMEFVEVDLLPHRIVVKEQRQ